MCRLFALCSQWPLCLVPACPVGLSSLPVQSTLTTFSWKSLAYPFICRNYVCFTFALGRNCHLYGGSRQALSLGRRRGNQTPSQASNWHFPSLLALCPDPFLAVICALIFGNGLWLACFSGLCAFIGGRKIFPLSSKGQQIFHWNWTGLGLCYFSRKQA